MRLLNYLNEKIDKLNITIKDIKLIQNRLFGETGDNVKFLLNYWYEGNKEQVNELLDIYTEALNKALSILQRKSNTGGIYVNKKQTLIGLFDDLPMNVSDCFPMVMNISALPNDDNTIGLIIHENGKIEEFEGNEEANHKTVDLVDDILGTSKVEVTVYGNHNIELVRKIEKNNVLPRGLYVSPDKRYVEGYWSTDEDRVMFSCVALKSDFYRESETDWKTKDKTKIKKFRYV